MENLEIILPLIFLSFFVLLYVFQMLHKYETINKIFGYIIFLLWGMSVSFIWYTKCKTVKVESGQKYEKVTETFYRKIK